MKPTTDTIKRIMADNPELTDFGFGTFAKPQQSAEERKQAFDKDRADLTTAMALEGVGRAYQWLMAHKGDKKLFRDISSYGLKHTAQPAIGYTTNGQFIAAAIAAGFLVKRIDDGPNATLSPP